MYDLVERNLMDFWVISYIVVQHVNLDKLSTFSVLLLKSRMPCSDAYTGIRSR